MLFVLNRPCHWWSLGNIYKLLLKQNRGQPKCLIQKGSICCTVQNKLHSQFLRPNFVNPLFTNGFNHEYFLLFLFNVSRRHMPNDLFREQHLSHKLFCLYSTVHCVSPCPPITVNRRGSGAIW